MDYIRIYDDLHEMMRRLSRALRAGSVNWSEARALFAEMDAFSQECFEQMIAF